MPTLYEQDRLQQRRRRELDAAMLQPLAVAVLSVAASVPQRRTPIADRVTRTAYLRRDDGRAPTLPPCELAVMERGS